MDKLLKKYMSQVVIENAGLDTTDDDELGTDYVSIILRIPIAMLTEYQRVQEGAGTLDLVKFWKYTGLYDELCFIAESNYLYHFAIDALEFLGGEVSGKSLSILNDETVRVEFNEEWSADYRGSDTSESYQTTFDY